MIPITACGARGTDARDDRQHDRIALLAGPKAGSTAMVDVVHYAEPVTAKGFVVMDTPGYDPVSMTGIVAGGANACVLHYRETVEEKGLAELVAQKR